MRASQPAWLRILLLLVLAGRVGPVGLVSRLTQAWDDPSCRPRRLRPRGGTRTIGKISNGCKAVAGAVGIIRSTTYVVRTCGSPCSLKTAVVCVDWDVEYRGLM